MINTNTNKLNEILNIVRDLPQDSASITTSVTGTIINSSPYELTIYYQDKNLELHILTGITDTVEIHPAVNSPMYIYRSDDMNYYEYTDEVTQIQRFVFFASGDFTLASLTASV